MFQKWFRILIVLGVLFSYFPVMPAEYCPKGDQDGSHREGGKLNCGYIFHCPFTFDLRFSEPLVILNIEKLVPISSSITSEDFRFPIFHPPEEKV